MGNTHRDFFYLKLNKIKNLIIARLKTVIDPETGADVIRLRLVENLTLNKQGDVTYTFRPSSPLCSIAVYLVQQIKQAVSAPALQSKQSQPRIMWLPKN